ncbi:MAG: sensor histidine kinase [Pseudomonadota bacterium]
MTDAGRMAKANGEFHAGPDATARAEGAGVIHDLGNLIQIANSALNLISRSGPVRHDEALLTILTRAKVSLERAGTMVRQTMAQATTGVASASMASEFAVAACLAQIKTLMTWVSEPRASLTIDVPADLVVRCNPIDLQNAVLNLVINARDALPDGGSIAIIGRAADADSGAVFLVVRDDGIGMHPDTMARAPAPGFTTKSSSEGHGFGLSMVQRFVDEAGGRMHITSGPGLGTTVGLQLPGTSLQRRHPAAETIGGRDGRQR